MSVTINATNVTVVDKVRKCGGCGSPGHDKRNCPTNPSTTPKLVKKDTAKEDAEKEANHLRFMSREFKGAVRPTDPKRYWDELGADSGTYPFQRDFKGAMHLPKIATSDGGYTSHTELMKLPEYSWDSTRKLFMRKGECPGCV
jgi:hypothetical protein